MMGITRVGRWRFDLLLFFISEDECADSAHKHVSSTCLAVPFKDMRGWGGRGQQAPLIIITAGRPWPVRPDSARQPNQKTHLLLAFTSNEAANGDKWAPFARRTRLMASLISMGRRRSDGDEEEGKMGTLGVR